MPILLEFIFIFVAFLIQRSQFMEIRVYLNQQNWRSHKPILTRRIDCPEVFSFNDCISVMRSLFGIESVIEFIVV